MKNPSTIAFILAAPLLLPACNGSNGSAPLMGAFQVVNAIPDSQPLDVDIQSITTDINNIAFGSASGFRDEPEGSYNVQMTTTPAGGGNSVTITTDNVSIDHNNQTTVYGLGTLAQSSAAGLVVERNSSVTIASGQTEVQFVDAVAAALTSGTGTVYVVTPGQGTTNPIYSVTLQSPVGNSSSQTPAFSTPTQIASGTYEIIVQDATNTTVFDSGSNGISFNSGDSVQIAAMDATAAQLSSNGSAMQMLEIDNASGNATTLLNGAN